MIVAIFGTEQLKSPKSIESMKSKFMDSVTTFSEKQKILQKVCKKVSIKTTLSFSSYKILCINCFVRVL